MADDDDEQVEVERSRRVVVAELIRKQVGDWDDEVMLNARFKAFSGQRSDWEPRYFFWRDLIINIARQLRLFLIRPSELEMYNAGDVLCSDDLVDPRNGRLTQLFKRVANLVGLSRSSIPLIFSEDDLIISTLLREKAVEVVKVLSENHWTSSCIVTMRKFQDICGGPKETSAILSHLSHCGKLKHLAINKKDLIEGVKVSLSLEAVSDPTSLDYDVLHLTWTAEKLQQQLHVIDQRCDKSKKSALAFLKSGKKEAALRHARELKLASQSREKCTTLLNRVEEVLRAIADAEDSKEVFEVVRIGAKAIKEKNITVEEAQHWLEELDEIIDSQKQVENVLGFTPYASIDDEEIEDELEKLDLECGRESSKVPISKVAGGTEIKETAESLSNALSNLKLANNAATESVVQDLTEHRNVNISKDLELEAG